MNALAHSPSFQYPDATYQSETAIAGMWLFLATEVLFFGALILGWIYCRHGDMSAFDLGARQTDLTIGTINSLILISSSLCYTLGSQRMEAGDARGLIRYGIVTWLLGAAFLILKFGIEWRDDLERHFLPGADFAIHGPAAGGAQLFFSFYFISTGLHGLHMVVGLGLVAWILRRASAGDFSASYSTPVSVVGLYWSFVDIVWIVLYPLIYLVGRGP